ncbi:hypothetical protein SAMN06265379_110107 [Saccharicrinis carchari]|uniref:Surface antigen n=1 Tax=Saccharicrinis carchari TaxID=1168039 RepID=A0A521ERX0_SACCC|nr:hypothetical protein [Saccharicrinis carchari]SMO86161.1 hypothetical protein SAMN06265379_110107 [Saccharicrinis carchari]
MKLTGYLVIKKKALVLGCLFGLLKFTVNAQTDTLSHADRTGIMQRVANFADWGVDLITFKKENYTFFLLPVMAYEERTKLAIGVMPVWRFYLGKGKAGRHHEGLYYRPSNVSPSLVTSTTGMYQFEFNSDFYFIKDWYIQSKWIYQWMPDKYYPVGNDVDKTLYSDVDIKKIEFAGRLMKGLNKEVFVGLNYDVGFYDVKNKYANNLTADIAGFNGQNVVGGGLVVSYDSRNSIVYSNTGSFVSVAHLWYPKKLGDFAFSTLTFDARHFFKLGSRGKVLGAQLYIKSATGNIPFYRMPVLGGKNLFRGIAQPYKYMDKNSMYLQAAYRSPIWWRLGYEVFAGAGRVHSQWDGSLLKHMHLMGGLGLRVKVLEEEGLSVRFDYGMSTTGDTGLFFTLGEAF